MIDRRSFLFGLFAAVTAGAVTTGVVEEAEATPGAVTKSGCHGRPKHCHSSGEIRRSGKRRYVAGHFSKGRRKRRRR